MLDKEKIYFFKRFNKLKYDKRGYRLLDVSKNIELWELRCSLHTAIVGSKYIAIENIEYEKDIHVYNDEEQAAKNY
ncbi:MAG: hypothetical protein U9Q69_06030 [Nanoarchaeota archaeon]|nr:hypothetical protein [Nanoarchaeota archaeon]